MMSIQLPADMFGEMTSTSVGVTTLDGKAVSGMAEELALGAMGAACGAAGLSPDVASKGISDLKLVGGTDMGHDASMAAVAAIKDMASLSHEQHSEAAAPAAVPGQQADRGMGGIG